MDLASGYSDSINYGNGYTPLATGAINNNNADYQRNQMAMALMAQNYNPYANSGGSFGAQPAYYAAQGAAYTGATGGGGNIYAPQQSVFETGAAPFYDPQNAGNGLKSLPGGIGSDAARAPNQPALTPQQYYVGGFTPYSPQTFAPAAQQNVGTGQPNVEAPRSVFDTGTSAFNPYASQPWWSTFERTAGPQGVTDWLRGQGVSSGGGGYQQTGMSMQERPDDRQQNELASGQRYRDATNTSPAIDPTQGYANMTPDTAPGWGYKPYDFPTAPAYPEPRQDFGSPDYPLIMYDKGDAGSRLLDPNMLNRQDNWTNRS